MENQFILLFRVRFIVPIFSLLFSFFFAKIQQDFITSTMIRLNFRIFNEQSKYYC